MTVLDDLKRFDLHNGALSLWAMRKTETTGEPAPKYRGHWVSLTDELQSALKSSIGEARDRITETIEYDLLAQNNEGSALTITTIETHGGLIVDATREQTEKLKCKKLKDIQNVKFYSVRIAIGDSVLHAVRKTDDSWKSKKARSLMNAVFVDQQLDIRTDTTFTLSKYFDFIILNGTIFIINKAAFEQILSYKEGHAKDFSDLKAEPEFTRLFAEMVELDNYVGTNRMHLRRVSSIRQKGHYKDDAFMGSLRSEYTEAELNIKFNDDGLIVPTAESCPDIFQALLDHRLTSKFSKKNYDVQSTKVI